MAARKQTQNKKGIELLLKLQDQILNLLGTVTIGVTADTIKIGGEAYPNENYDIPNIVAVLQEFPKLQAEIDKATQRILEAVEKFDLSTPVVTPTASTVLNEPKLTVTTLQPLQNEESEETEEDLPTPF